MIKRLKKYSVLVLAVSLALSATVWADNTSTSTTSSGAGPSTGSMVDKSIIGRILQRAQDEHENAASTASSTTSTQIPANALKGDAYSGDYDQYPGFLKQASANSFAKVVRNTVPMTPHQIITLHKLINNSKHAVATYPGTPPKPTSSSEMVDLSPGAPPPVIRLREGYITSVVFLDATGQPWPIHAYDLGNSALFGIQWDQKGNTLLIQAKSTYQQGNLAVMLKGLNTPIMITLIPGQQVMDYRIDMRIPRLGPDAVSAQSQDLPQTADPRLLNVLDGIPPNGATRLTTSQMGTDAWLMGNTMFVRTSLRLLSPSFTSSISSNSGMHAYQVAPSPVLLVMQHGKIKKIAIKGF